MFTREFLKDGTDFNRLVKTQPDDVISILRDHAVQKVGEFKSNVIAFSNRCVLDVN